MGKEDIAVSHPGLNLHFPENADQFFMFFFDIELISFVKCLLVECRFYP